MTLSDEDVREILRIIDETPLAELRAETNGFSLHVVRDSATGGSPPAAAPQSRPSQQPEPSQPNAAPRRSADVITITAPMLGVFYRSEGPGKEPFVELGSEVAPDTTLCIIEVMKMMNSIPAGIAGAVVEVCQANAAVVEEGAPLFRIRPG